MSDFFQINSEEQVARLEAAGREALSQWNFAGASLSLIKYRENVVTNSGCERGQSW